MFNQNGPIRTKNKAISLGKNGAPLPFEVSLQDIIHNLTKLT